MSAASSTSTAAPRESHRKPHWYVLRITECPVCGSCKEERERIYGAPPARFDPRRIDRIIRYDWCEQ